MTNSDPEYTDPAADSTGDDQPADVEQADAGTLPGPDDEIQVTGHVLGPGDGVEYDGPNLDQDDTEQD